MKTFNSLMKSTNTKRTFSGNIEEFYSNNFYNTIDYSFLEQLYVRELLDLNKKKKYDTNLITLWAKLEMKSYVYYKLGKTVNLYFVNCSKPVEVNKLIDYNFMPEFTRRMVLLDVKYVKSFVLKDVKFNNIYLATYEIMDQNEVYRPYIEIFSIDDNTNEFIKIGYGYDSNDNDTIELFIVSYNYPLFLDCKGYLFLPIIGKMGKLDIYDYISDKDIEKILKIKE